MKKPTQYKLKEWLCDNFITGLKIDQNMTSADTWDVIWVLIADDKSKRVKADDVEELVNVKPDHAAVMRETEEVREEIDKYREFVKNNKEELEEYERLKQKFNN